MDSRFASAESALLNQLIDLINQYLKDHVDDFLMNDKLCDDIKQISFHIYEYAKINFDVDSILSKQNLLSMDIVLFPNISEIIVIIQENQPHFNEFANSLHQIKSVMVKRKNEDNVEYELYKKIQKIIFKYDLNRAMSY